MNDPRLPGESRSLATDHLDLWASALLVKSTAGRGNNGRLEAYGIKKLRTLIFELAMRGRLVPQDLNDEPASKLLKRIAAKKKLLISGLKSKQQDLWSEVSEEEKPYVLPASWGWARLPDIAVYRVGKTPSTKAPTYWSEGESGVPWVSISDMEHYGLIKTTGKKVTKKAIEDVFGYEPIPKGSLLMSFKLTVGKIAVLDVDAYHNEAIISLQPYAEISKEFLFKVLPFSAQGGDTKRAIMGNTLNSSSLALLLVPIPPLAEQRRIVAKVDELMALCDQLEQQQGRGIEAHQTLVETLLGTLTNVESAQEFAAAWSRIAEHFDTLFTTEHSIDQLKQTILQLAVMGKLVPQNSNAEPAIKLLHEIAKRKEDLVAEGVLRKQPSYVAISEDEALFALPPGWVFARFGEVTFNRDAERVPLSVEERSGRRGQYDYYGASGVIDSIDGYLFDKPLLLIGEDGANLINRSTPIAFMARGKYWVNNHAHVIDGLTEDLLLYICLHINAINLEPYVTGTAQPKMNQAKMNAIVLAVPPKEEQRRIVDKVDELMALCDALKARLAEAQATQIHLADAIVERAVAEPELSAA